MSIELDQLLAGFALDTKPADIPTSSLAVARLSFLDWLAVGIAGQQEPVSQIVRRMIAEEGNATQASVFGDAQKVSVRAAALANGAISHALDYDDTHFIYIGHPSVAVFPAAFAVAQSMRCPRDEMLNAALLGLEAACRVGDWLGRDHYQQGFHQTATAGCIGAVVACARILKLSHQQTRYAIGLAATRASGLKSQFGTMGKPYHAGMAASNAVEVAKLAGLGFVSRTDSLQCEQGFAETHHGQARDEAFDQLGAHYVFDSVQHKFHACCHGLHAALEALKEARSENTLSPADVQEIQITIHPRWLTVCNIESPASGLEAKFSYRMTAAMMMHDYATDAINSYTDSLCSDRQLLSFCDKVTVMSDESLNETEAQVSITTQSGECIAVQHDLAGMLPLEQRTAKVKGKCSTLLGSDHVARLWEIITNDSNDLTTIGKIMQGVKLV